MRDANLGPRHAAASASQQLTDTGTGSSSLSRRRYRHVPMVLCSLICQAFLLVCIDTLASRMTLKAMILAWPIVLTAIGLLALRVLAWNLALVTAPLSRVYPWTALSPICFLAAATFFLNEDAAINEFIGAAIISLAIALHSLTKEAKRCP